MADQNEAITPEEIQRLLGQRSPAGETSDDAPQKPPPSEVLADASLDEGAGGTRLNREGPDAQRPTPPADSGETNTSNRGHPHPKAGADDRTVGQVGTVSPDRGQPTPKGRANETPPGGGSAVPQRDVEYLLNQAQRALESISSATPAGTAPFRLEEFVGAPASTENATLDLINDVELDLRIELGRTHLHLEDVLRLRKGSVVPLDKLAGDPVDIYVNERLIARGEVLVLNDNFCIRVGELIAGSTTNP